MAMNFKTYHGTHQNLFMKAGIKNSFDGMSVEL